MRRLSCVHASSPGGHTDDQCIPAVTPLLASGAAARSRGRGDSRAFRLYEAFLPAEARRLVERFEWHYTPKHGSWLDLAESELGVLSSQCLDRRIADKQILIDEIAAWEHDRNAHHTKANWHFTTPNARIKLKHLYPSI
jgi:hypothetical protein